MPRIAEDEAPAKASIRSRQRSADGRPNRGMIIRLAVAALLSALTIGGILAARVWPVKLAHLAGTILGLERSLGQAGWLVAFLVQMAIALCGVLPASAGALTAGMLYGVGPGFVVSGSATLAGALLAFLLSRSLFRPVIAGLLARRRRLALLDEAVARDGWRLVCLLRISPVMPFAVTSYALGLTGLPLLAFLAGTLASLPALLGYVAIGALAKGELMRLSTPEAGSLRILLLGLAIAATALLTLRLGRIIRGVLRLDQGSTADGGQAGR